MLVAQRSAVPSLYLSRKFDVGVWLSVKPYAGRQYPTHHHTHSEKLNGNEALQLNRREHSLVGHPPLPFLQV